DATPLLLKISIIDLFWFQSTRTACRSQARPFLPRKSALRAFMGHFGAFFQTLNVAQLRA
ncbi:hypothetical protein ACPCWF_19565, partial [Pseudomonas atacamensis]